MEGMLKKRLGRAIAAGVIWGFALSQGVSIAAVSCLRPKAADLDGKSAKALSYGLQSKNERRQFHDMFAKEAEEAFQNAGVVNLIGHTAQTDLSKAVQDFVDKNPDADVKKEKLLERLTEAKAFLDKALDDDTLLRAIDEASAEIEIPTASSSYAAYFAGMSPEKGRSWSSSFPALVDRVSYIKDRAEKLRAARRVLIEDTRFAIFLAGKSANATSLYSVGVPTSQQHKAFVMHMGSHQYAGSEDIAGKPRSLYAALGRIEGFAGRGEEGLAGFRDAFVHEVKDHVKGWHNDESPEIMARLEKINRDIDRETAIAAAASAFTAIDPTAPEKAKEESPRGLIFQAPLAYMLPHILPYIGEDKVAIAVKPGGLNYVWENGESTRQILKRVLGPYIDKVLIVEGINNAYDELYRKYPGLKKFYYFTANKDESAPAGVERKLITKNILDVLRDVYNDGKKLKEFEKQVEVLYQL